MGADLEDLIADSLKANGRGPMRPYARTGVDRLRIEAAVRELLLAIGENPDRPGLVDTPARVARYWAEFMDYDPGRIHTTFDESACEAPVVVAGMRVHTLCEHHLLPFWCDMTIAYIPHGKVIGLSKLARIAHMHAHRLQLQERLVVQTAETVQQVAATRDVMVLGSGEHSCMATRGIKTNGLMTSQDASGAFLADPHLRSEVYAQHRAALR